MPLSLRIEGNNIGDLSRGGKNQMLEESGALRLGAQT